MECPHCKGELPSLICATCGRQALQGALFCHHCGHELPDPKVEPPKLITCDYCSHKMLPGSNYCSACGESTQAKGKGEGEGGYDPGARVACSDGLCVGIIGPDGKCTECGKPAGEE